MIGVGEIAPPLELPDLSATDRGVSPAPNSEPVLAVFWKPSCGTCDLAFPYLQRLYQAYPSEGWRMLAISQEDASVSDEFARKYGVTFPVLTEGDGWPISTQYDPDATPTMFLISPDGKIELASAGFDKEALNEVSRLIAGHLGLDAQIIAVEDDGNPSFRPG